MKDDTRRTAKTTAQIKKEAKYALRPVFGEAAAVIMIKACVAFPLVILGAVMAFSDDNSFLLALFCGIGSIQLILLGAFAGALSVGSAGYFFNVASMRDPQVIQMFSSFKSYRNSVAMNLLRALFTLLRSVLFIAPGVRAALGYAMTPYILAAAPGMKARDALKLSNRMMKGRRAAYLRLLLSFTGWFFIGLLTAGIGFFFILPYIETSKAVFFIGLSEESGTLVEVDAEADTVNVSASQESACGAASATQDAAFDYAIAVARQGEIGGR
ncbi:MAG: DUF975 family protein [Clostridia bacterium]|nr:DUF975 family protein [Clostridia bacterium]